MENSLSPAFVKINYQSEYAPHSMTIPTVPLIAAVGDAPPYFDLRGAEIDYNADTGIRDFVNLLKAIWSPLTTFVDYTLYTQAGVGDTPVPVWSAPLTIVGTSGMALVHKAVQGTMSFRATDFTLSKLVFLDYQPGLGYDKQSSVAGSDALNAIKNYAVAPETWLASRGGGRPNTFLSLTTTLNEKLRRSYRMT